MLPDISLNRLVDFWILQGEVHVHGSTFKGCSREFILLFCVTCTFDAKCVELNLL